MKQHHIDLVLIVIIGLLTIANVLHSATGGEQVAVVLSSLSSLAATAIVSSLLIGYRRFTRRTTSPGLIVPGVALLIIVSVATTHWPLRVTYAVSRDAFDSVARRVRQGNAIETPVRAGLFTIQRAEVSRQGIVCLWTLPNPSGNTGFVRCRPNHTPLNIWSAIHLDDHWQFVSED